MNTCTHAHTFTHTHMRTYTCTCTHTLMHTHMHTHMHACTSTARTCSPPLSLQPVTRRYGVTALALTAGGCSEIDERAVHGFDFVGARACPRMHHCAIVTARTVFSPRLYHIRLLHLRIKRHRVCPSDDGTRNNVLVLTSGYAVGIDYTVLLVHFEPAHYTRLAFCTLYKRVCPSGSAVIIRA